MILVEDSNKKTLATFTDKISAHRFAAQAVDWLGSGNVTLTEFENEEKLNEYIKEKVDMNTGLPL